MRWGCYSSEALPHARVTFVVCALGLLACSSDAPPPAVVGGAPVLTAPADPNDAACAGSTAPHPPSSSCVGVVHGQLIDSADKPVSSVVTVCGGGVLCTGSTADEGLFQVKVNRFVDLSTFVFWVHGYPNHADMIVPLERATTSDITLDSLPRVPRFESMGDVLPPSTASGGVFRSGPIELTLAANTATIVAPAHENSRGLFVGTVPDLTKWGADLVAMYALGPPGARFAPNVDVAITLPDTAGIADGTTLDLVVLDDDLLGGHPGTLVRVGSATVTKGVARSVAGAGIDRLTWVGVRVPRGN